MRELSNKSSLLNNGSQNSSLTPFLAKIGEESSMVSPCQGLRKGIVFLLILATLCTILFSSSSFAKMPVEGSWKYSVKFEDTTLFNKKFFIENYWEERGIELAPNSYMGKRAETRSKNNKITKQYGFTGGKKFSLKDTLYTGYLKFSESEGNHSVIGSYFPHKFSNPSDHNQIHIVKTSQGQQGEWQLLWYEDFREKRIGKEQTLWATLANYNPKKDSLEGYTVVLSCSSQSCFIKNIAKWQANRIEDIAFYTRENYSWKPLIARILRFLIPNESFYNLIIGDERFAPYKKYSDYHPLGSNSKEKYIKTSLLAMLPAKAGPPWPRKEPAQALKEICDPFYCNRTQRFWEGEDQQEKIDTCSDHIAGGRALCCDVSAGNLTGQELTQGNPLRPACFCTQSNSKLSSSKCCRAFVSCKQVVQQTVGAGFNKQEYNFQNFGIDKNMEVPPDYEIYTALHLNTLMQPLVTQSNSSGLHNPLNVGNQFTFAHRPSGTVSVVDDIFRHFLPGNDFTFEDLQARVCQTAGDSCIPYSAEVIFRDEYVEISNIPSSSRRRTNRVYDYFEYPGLGY